MNYTKPALSFLEQAQLLISRGLVSDEEELTRFLSQVNYYRLTGYLYRFRVSSTEDNFIPGTSLAQIQELYSFDRKLRLLMFDGIEKIEIAIFRSQMVELFAKKYGAFGFILRGSFKPKGLFPLDFHTELLKFSAETLKTNTSDYIKKYRGKYTGENHLPCWMLFETMTFGSLSMFFSNLHPEDRISLAKRYGQDEKVLTSWLRAITLARNICAHHGRLWNRYISVGLAIPKEKNDPNFHNPVKVSDFRTKIFPILVVIQYLLNCIDGDNEWGTNLDKLISEYPGLPIGEIGFPPNWRDVPFWH